MAEYIDLIIKHGGAWNKEDDKNWVYEGGTECDKGFVDIDMLSYHRLFRYERDLGYSNGVEIWYKMSGISGTIGLEEIMVDQHVKEWLDFNKDEKTNNIFRGQRTSFACRLWVWTC